MAANAPNRRSVRFSAGAAPTVDAPELDNSTDDSPSLKPTAPGPSTRSTGQPPLRRGVSVSRGKWAQLDRVVEDMVTMLKRRQIRGSSLVARRTCELLRTVVANGKFSNVADLVDMIRNVGKTLNDAHPIELAIGNIVRRVLYIVRQESVAVGKEVQAEDGSVPVAGTGAGAQPAGSVGVGVAGAGMAGQAHVDLTAALHKIFDEEKHQGQDYTQATGSTGTDFLVKVKQPIIEEINELIDEIKTVYTNIAEQAVEHIHAQEIILTYGVSNTVLEFLKEAAKLRKFEVIVVESAPSYSGQGMAVQLAQHGIEATVITDSAVFALMPAVNKVIVGTHAVMANGGLITYTGAHNIAVAAKAHSVPFVVVTGLYKLCPLYAFDQDTFNELNAPSEVLNFEEDWVHKVDVENPAFDYVAPELISLFVTNFGGHNPSYIYRLLAEYYNPEDYSL